MTQTTRSYIYLAATVILIGLLIAGIITNEDVAQYLGWIAAAIGLGTSGLAAANTPRNPDDGE